MADNEDDSGSIRKKSPPHAVFCSQSAGTQGTQPTQPLERVSASPSGSGAQLGHVLQRCPDEQSVIVGTELALGSDLVNTTIIYVQPDGSLVDGSGLTTEQQQALLEQLTKQELVQVSDLEAAQLLQQSQAKTVPVHSAVLEPSQLQQVINQVTKSKQPQVHIQASKQKQSQVPQQNLIQVPQLSMKNQNNASQQLKSVAQQVAMQTSGMVQVVQKKLEPVRIQIQVPPKQEVKPGAALQQNNVLVHQPQVKLSTNGSVSGAQIIHLQPVVGQQGQQFFFQQSPGDPHIQLLLQSPAPVVGSLLPVLHKVTGQTTKMATASAPSPKPAVSVSAVKTPPPSTTVSIPIIKSPANDPTAGKSPLKSPNINTPAPRQMTTPPPAAPDVKDKEKDDKKKVKKRQKKVLKVQTRSGRVSRPPKYKAKDYMFIKTEDLAESHQSDSDDYSDMSVEEEGEGGRKDSHVPGTSPSLTYSHKSRSHRCQTCDKAYIGPGGLNRHYKLNPSHGDPETPSNQPSNALGDISQSQETIATEGRDKTAAAMATNRVDIGPASAFGLKSCHHRGPGRPRGRGRGRGRGRLLAPSPKLPHMTVGPVSRRGRRGRPPKLSVTSEQQTQKRRDRLHELVEQCEDEELMDIVLPRLTQVLSLWELLLAKVERGGSARTRFPDVYREYESLQVHVKEAAQDYIINPQAGATPLEVTNIEVARSLGILDEVNRMKVVPGAAPASSLTNKNVRYMENSKMLPPSKRFKMENSIQVQQNGIEKYTTGGTTETSATSATSSLKTCSVSVSPLMIPDGSKLTMATDSASSSCGSTLVEALPPDTTTGVSSGEDQGEGPLLAGQVQSQHQVLKTPDIKAQMKELEEVQGGGPGSERVHTPGSTHTPESSESGIVQNLQDSESHSTDASESKELQEGQEIYIQTEGLTVQLAEPGSDRIVIVNGPDGTTMHIQTPEGIPLEAVQALLGIESSDGTRASQ